MVITYMFRDYYITFERNEKKNSGRSSSVKKKKKLGKRKVPIERYLRGILKIAFTEKQDQKGFNVFCKC